MTQPVPQESQAPAPHPPLTPGDTQAERTRLSWRRTTLSATLSVLLIGRLAVHDNVSPLGALAIALALICWLAFMWLTHRRITAMSHRVPATIGRTLPAVALTIVAFAVIGIILVVVGGVVV